MHRSFSIYLDLLRFVAAAAVFVSHWAAAPVTQGAVWWRLGQHGAVAVAVFFVLSGYVIAYVTDSREKDLASYARSRFSRLYSVVLVALVVTALLDHLGLRLDPDFYAHEKILRKPESWTSYLASLFLVNEYQVFEFGGIVPGTNGPYWSLSFEATYYLVAGLVLFCRPWLAWPLAVLVLALAGRTIAAMLPLWALGYGLYKLRGAGHRLSPALLWALLAATAAAIALLPSVRTVHGFAGPGIAFPWGVKPYERNLLEDYLAAALFALHLLAAQSLTGHVSPVSARTEKILRWLGGLTFPLYALHQPVLCFLAALSPLDAAGLPHALLLLAGTAAAVVALAPVCERLREALRAWRWPGLPLRSVNSK